MGNKKKLYAAIMDGKITNIPFQDFLYFLERLGFTIREAGGSHKSASFEGLEERLTLQAGKDGCAKPYQVRQARKLIIKYKIGGGEE